MRLFYGLRDLEAPIIPSPDVPSTLQTWSLIDAAKQLDGTTGSDDHGSDELFFIYGAQTASQLKDQMSAAQGAIWNNGTTSLSQKLDQLQATGLDIRAIAAASAAIQLSGAIPQSTTSGSAPMINGVTVVDRKTGVVYKGTVDLQPTLDRIAAGGSALSRNDGSVFQNRPVDGTQLLPAEPNGYYTEYVVPTPGVNGPGPQRLIVGQGGELYYTPDHYQSFCPCKKVE